MTSRGLAFTEQSRGVLGQQHFPQTRKFDPAVVATMIEAGRRTGQLALSVISSAILSLPMTISELINEIAEVYQKHGWQLRRALLRPETESANELGRLGDIKIEAAEIDALWFSRPSHQGREAWELRLIAENPYALFETFEADESEEEREDVRREMEARMREK